MTKVIEQECNSSIVVKTSELGNIQIGNELIEKSKAREVALAIYDFEKEKIDFAVGFAEWLRELSIHYINGTIRGKNERQKASDILEMDDDEQVKKYQQTLLTNGKETIRRNR